MARFEVKTVELCTYTYIVEASCTADAETRWAEFGTEVDCDLASTIVLSVTLVGSASDLAQLIPT